MTIYAIPSQLKLYPPPAWPKPYLFGDFFKPQFQKIPNPPAKVGGYELWSSSPASEKEKRLDLHTSQASYTSWLLKKTYPSFSLLCKFEPANPDFFY